MQQAANWKTGDKMSSQSKGDKEDDNEFNEVFDKEESSDEFFNLAEHSMGQLLEQKISRQMTKAVDRNYSKGKKTINWKIVNKGKQTIIIL